MGLAPLVLISVGNHEINCLLWPRVIIKSHRNLSVIFIISKEAYVKETFKRSYPRSIFILSDICHFDGLSINLSLIKVTFIAKVTSMYYQVTYHLSNSLSWSKSLLIAKVTSMYYQVAYHFSQSLLLPKSPQCIIK